LKKIFAVLLKLDAFCNYFKKFLTLNTDHVKINTSKLNYNKFVFVYIRSIFKEIIKDGHILNYKKIFQATENQKFHQILTNFD
jgi:hypothetical protein